MPSLLLSRRQLLAGAAASAGALLSARAQAAEAGAGPADDTIRIAFLGDSMVDGLWGGVERLVTREPCLSGRVKLLRFGENGTGLTRPARFDWIARAKTVVAEQRPTLSVISLGLNDRQSIVDGRGRFDLGTPGWRTRYGELVASLAQAAAKSTAGVLWIGIPVLRDAVSQDDAATKNAVFAEAIASLKDPRIGYVEPWRQAASGPDAFQPYGPDVGGSRVQIRAGDGIHFTAPGYDVVARYAMGAVVEHLRAQGVTLPYPCRA